MVHVVIVGGLVADAVLVWVGMGVADDVPRRAEAHRSWPIWIFLENKLKKDGWPEEFFLEKYIRKKDPLNGIPGEKSPPHNLMPLHTSRPMAPADHRDSNKHGRDGGRIRMRLIYPCAHMCPFELIKLYAPLVCLRLLVRFIIFASFEMVDFGFLWDLRVPPGYSLI